MSRVGASLGLASILAWALLLLFGLAFPPTLAGGLALAGGFALAFGFQTFLVIRGAVALLAPFGVMLPALALGSVLAGFGVALPGFTTWEIAGFLLAYTAFLCCAFGVIPCDVYRLGYAPLPVAGMVQAVCAYGALSGNWPVALVAVLGQCFWALKWGSSNWFDYVLHILMWPVALVILSARLF